MVADRVEPSCFDGAPPKIIWLKIGNQSKAAALNVLLSFKDEIEKAFVKERACIEIYL
ncbi:MAG: hypothetical protein ACYC05_09575 [Sulfuricella sp.]|nr:hypothetical protein [Gammaproteobacteria bacterium]